MQRGTFPLVCCVSQFAVFDSCKEQYFLLHYLCFMLLVLMAVTLGDSSVAGWHASTRLGAPTLRGRSAAAAQILLCYQFPGCALGPVTDC